MNYQSALWKALRPHLSEMECMKRISDYNSRSVGSDERINNRARIMDAIQENSINGFIYISVWQRDCDCAEWTHLIKIPATLQSYMRRYYKDYDNAEGPLTFNILSPEEAAEFNPESRDRILEAYENGNTYSV